MARLEPMGIILRRRRRLQQMAVLPPRRTRSSPRRRRRGHTKHSLCLRVEWVKQLRRHLHELLAMPIGGRRPPAPAASTTIPVGHPIPVPVGAPWRRPRMGAIDRARGVPRGGERRGALLGLGDGRHDDVLVPVGLAEQRGVRDGADLLEVHVHDALGELRDERMATVEVLALPAPAEAGKHVKREPYVLEGRVPREDVTLGHVAVENDHGGDVKRDRGCEECNVREPDKLVVHNDGVVRCDDRYRKCID